MASNGPSLWFCGLSPRSALLYMQRLRIFLILVLFSLIVALSYLGTVGNMQKMTIPGLNNPPPGWNHAKAFQQPPRPNSRPPPSTKQVSNNDKSPSIPQDRTYYNVSSPYHNIITNCSLVSLGQRYNDDKFTNHNYQNLYCEVLRDFQQSERKMRMLEIGFGCGHNVNQPNQQGVSALIWNEYFSHNDRRDSPSSGIDLYEVDLKSPAHLTCVKKYVANHTSDIVQAIYLGDQSNKPFLNEVVSHSGGLYDMVIDDGGHMMKLQKPSFDVLWNHVMPGGLYFIEDLDVLQPGEDREVFNRDIMGWIDMLASTNYPSHPDWNISKRITYTDWGWDDIPRHMISVHVQKIIAVFRKSYAFNMPSTGAEGANKNKAMKTTETAAVATTPLYVWDKVNQTQKHESLRQVNNHNSNHNNSNNSSNNSSNSNHTITNSSSSLHKRAILSASTTSWWSWLSSSTSSKSSSSNGTHPPVHPNYWQIKDQCPLLYQNNIMKVVYATLYCEIMRDFQTSPPSTTMSSSTPSTVSVATTTNGGMHPRKLRLLLVGSSADSNITVITNLWTSFFAGHGVEVMSVSQPWIASQPNKSSELLLEEIRSIGGGGYGSGGSGNATGGTVATNTVPAVQRGNYFDLIIHHVATYPYPLQKSIFELLWGPLLNHGGMYVMEGLETDHQGDQSQTQGGMGMIREIVAWAGSLLYNGRIADMHNGRKPNSDTTKDNYWSNLNGFPPPIQLLSIHCHAGICAMRKTYHKTKDGEDKRIYA